MYLIGDAGVEERQHVEECAACQAKMERLAAPLARFRGAVRDWSEGVSAAERAAGQGWTVIPAQDHLERLLLPSLEVPWYRSLWSGVCEWFAPPLPPLDVTARPVLVREVWGQYGRQKKSWAMSLALQSAAVVLLFTAALSPTVRQKVYRAVPLMAPAPALEPYAAPPDKTAMTGGGGGGDRSPLPASKGRLPRADLKQFTPPMAVVANLAPKLSMDPTIIAPPDVLLPDVKMSQYGDPLGRLGPPSNGPGSGGGIGSGSAGGVGSGRGAGFGPGEAGGIGGGVFRAGGGVSAPALIYKVEPEYSEEARKSKYQGTVVLYVEIDPGGHARNMRVMRSLGLGLDEKAMEAVRKWRFRPGLKDGKPVTVAATIEVNFRLL